MDTETETEKRMSQSSSLLKIAQDGDLFVLTMDRPDKRNSLNNQLIEEFIAFFERPPTEARAVVLHGRGDHFCAGLDLMEMLATRTNNTILEQRRSKAWYRAFDLIQFGEIPVISVLQGAVVGAAWSWRRPPTRAWRSARPSSSCPRASGASSSAAAARCGSRA